MTVKELKEKLEKFQDNEEVVFKTKDKKFEFKAFGMPGKLENETGKEVIVPVSIVLNEVISNADLRDIVLNKTKEFIIDLTNSKHFPEFFIITYGWSPLSIRFLNGGKYLYFSPEPIVLNINTNMFGREEEYRRYCELFDEIPEKFKNVPIIPAETYLELRKNSVLPKDDFAIPVSEKDRFEVYSYLIEKGYTDKNNYVFDLLSKGLDRTFLCIEKDSNIIKNKHISSTKNVFFFEELER